MSDRRHKPPIEVGLARLSYLNALDDGNLALLKYRLRTGNVSREEMALAADLLDEIKPHKRRNTRKRDIATTVLTWERIAPRNLRKNTIPEFAKTLHVSERYIYDALAKFGDSAAAALELSLADAGCLEACAVIMRAMIDCGGFDPVPLGKVTKRIIDQTIALTVLTLERSRPTKNIISDVARMFDLSESDVSDAVAEFGDAARTFDQECQGNPPINS